MNKPLIQIAFMTGRSIRDNRQLSVEQRDCLSQLNRPGRKLIMSNFSYEQESLESSALREVGLLSASLNNSRDYITSRWPSFRKRYQAPFIDFLDLAHHTIIISGSCGLELFNNLHLPERLMNTTSIIAYGAVARKRPRCHHLLVQGDRDWISRIWFRRGDYQISCGHMDYLTNTRWLEILEQFIKRIEFTLVMK